MVFLLRGYRTGGSPGMLRTRQAGGSSPSACRSKRRTQVRCDSSTKSSGLKSAAGIRPRSEIGAKRLPDRCEDDRDILRWCAALVAPDMAVPVVDIALAGLDDLRRARGVVDLIECQRAPRDGDEDRARVRMPPR